MTRTERTYYVISCLYRLSWSALGPTYAVFLIGRGLDLLQVNLVLAVYLITTCLFEIPTGAVADLFGRKISFVLSCLIRSLAFGMYFFSDSFGEFIVAELVDAIGTTLATGAFDAWAVDGMREEGDHRAPDRVFARAMMLGQATAIVGGFGAAQLAQHNIAWPWLVGTAGFFVSGLAGMAFMREERPPSLSWAQLRGSAHLSIATTVREGLAAVRDMPVMRGLCLMTLLMAFGGMPAFHMWQPRLESVSGEGPWLLGWVWVFLNLAVMLGNAVMPRMVSRWGRGPALAVTYAWRALCLGVAGAAAGFPLVLTGFLLQEIGLGVAEPVLHAWMNEHASTAQRATILSVRSMAFTLGGASGLICLGWIAVSAGTGAVWMIAAACYALAVPGYLALGRVAARFERQSIPPEPLRISA